MPKKANAKALDALKKGAGSLIFTIPEPKTDFSVLLADIDLEKTPIHLNFGFLDVESIKRLLSMTDGQKANIFLNLDIIGHLAKDGNWYHNLEKDRHFLSDILIKAIKANIKCSLKVDVSMYQNSGANMVQQLAYGLAHAHEYPVDAPPLASWVRLAKDYLQWMILSGSNAADAYRTASESGIASAVFASAGRSIRARPDARTILVV